MSDILKLNEDRVRLQRQVSMMGMQNTPTDPALRLASDARYQLAVDAWMKAEMAYQSAIQNLNPMQLAAYASPSQNSDEGKSEG